MRCACMCQSAWHQWRRIKLIRATQRDKNFYGMNDNSSKSLLSLYRKALRRGKNREHIFRLFVVFGDVTYCFFLLLFYAAFFFSYRFLSAYHFSSGVNWKINAIHVSLAQYIFVCKIDRVQESVEIILVFFFLLLSFYSLLFISFFFFLNAKIYCFNACIQY